MSLVVQLLLATMAIVVEGFYLPGVTPKRFLPNEVVPVKVNSLKSRYTHLPFDYYALPFCPKPASGRSIHENLGEILIGEKLEPSAYDLKMDQPETCKILCKQTYSAKQIKLFKEKIDEEYTVNWVVDNLPAASVTKIQGGEEHVFYEHGYFLGGHLYKDGEGPLDRLQNNDDRAPIVESWYLNNHISITIKTHSGDFEGKRVVQVEVEAKSIRHSNTEWVKQPTYMPVPNECVDPEGFDRTYMFIDGEDTLKDGQGNVEVVWTYDIQWEPSEIRWASRWDIYLSMDHRYSDQVHWFSIINSVLIIFLLTGMVAFILVRALRKDVMYYNRVLTDEERAEEKEESGWKLVHGDVFRPPVHFPMLFSVLVGTSTQVLGMTCVTLVFAALGFLSPANRGSLMIAVISLFVLMGSAAGYTASRMYKNFGGKEWQRCILLTAFLFPGGTFVMFFIVNFAIWYTGSSGYVDFVSLLSLVALWFGISVPLTFLGAYFGFRKPRAEVATAVSPYPRAIPSVPWFLRPRVTIPIGGILPFGAVFVEMYFILTSLWNDQFYYVYGFLVMVFAILMITCAELTIVMVYFQLCAEDYRWWWRSFVTSGCCAFYMFLYCCYYFYQWYSKMQVVLFVTGLEYFVYMWMASVGLFLVTGVVGFISTYAFVHTIYGALKVD
eukprot:g2715.t1